MEQQEAVHGYSGPLDNKFLNEDNPNINKPFHHENRQHKNNQPAQKFYKDKGRKTMTNLLTNSDKGSVNSKKSKYQNLKINIAGANAVAKNEGLLGAGTIPSNTTSRPPSL